MPLASSRWIRLPMGASPNPQTRRKVAAASSGDRSLRSGKSACGRRKRSSIQSLSRNAVTPVPRAVFLSVADIFDIDRKLAVSGSITGRSSPEKNSIGKRRRALIDSRFSGSGAYSLDSYPCMDRTCRPSSFARRAFVNPRRLRANCSLDGLKNVITSKFLCSGASLNRHIDRPSRGIILNHGFTVRQN